MKRVFLFFAVVTLAAFLAGCSSAPAAAKAPNLDKSFSAEADIAYGSNECTVQMKRIDKGMWEFCVTSPYALEGLVISLKNGVTKLSMYDMNAVADINGEAVSIAKLLSDAYEAAIGCVSAEKSDNGEITLRGQAESSVYALVTDKDGAPVTLSLDGGNVEASFTKFVMLERDEAVLD